MRRLRCRREGTATSGLIAVVSLLAHITSALAFASKPPGHTARFTCSARCAARAGEVTMILDRLNRWKQVDFVLASNSPRRKEILSNILGLKVRIVPSTFEENLDKSKFGPQDYVKENARQKSLEVWKRLSSAGDRPGMVVGGDTVVVYQGEILEKPLDHAHAFRMLRMLSGKDHKVYTGVTLIYGENDDVKEHCFVEETSVSFAALSDADIEAYIESGEPMDKAGGYGIQSLGGCFVTGIQGCYYNVMGFPLHSFCRELSHLASAGFKLQEGN